MLLNEPFLAHWLTLVACVGQLTLAVLAVARAATSPLALPLAWLSMGLFSWNFASLAHVVSGANEWRYLDVALSPLTIPLTLNFMASFVGRRRAHAKVLAAAWVAFGALGLGCLSALVWPAARAFAGSSLWAALCLVGAVGSVVYTLHLLRAHSRRVSGAEEQKRTRLVVWALIVGGGLTITELLADLGLPVPRAGNLGTLVAALLLATVALRFRLLEETVSTRAVVSAVTLGVLAVVAYLGVFHFFQSHVAMLVFGTTTVTLALLALVARVSLAHAAERERLRRLATLGRLSAQMAHDLKNPIAAVKGAIQFIEADGDDPRGVAMRLELLHVAAEEIDRLGRVVDRYHRLGRLESVRESISINALVGRLVRSQSLDTRDGVEVRAELADELPECAADAELVESALENLVRNAREASCPGSVVTVFTERTADGGDSRVTLGVRDRGRGIDPRGAERAFDDFFTTKRHGSGMGLFFVKRVAEAHGGDASLVSVEGRGTEARLWLPIHG